MRRRISDACQHSCLIILDQLKVFQGLFVCLLFFSNNLIKWITKLQFRNNTAASFSLNKRSNIRAPAQDNEAVNTTDTGKFYFFI